MVIRYRKLRKISVVMRWQMGKIASRELAQHIRAKRLSRSLIRGILLLRNSTLWWYGITVIVLSKTGCRELVWAGDMILSAISPGVRGNGLLARFVGLFAWPESPYAHPPWFPPCAPRRWLR